jgi:hypothetical protein
MRDTTPARAMSLRQPERNPVSSDSLWAVDGRSTGRSNAWSMPSGIDEEPKAGGLGFLCLFFLAIVFVCLLFIPDQIPADQLPNMTLGDDNTTPPAEPVPSQPDTWSEIGWFTRWEIHGSARQLTQLTTISGSDLDACAVDVNQDGVVDGGDILLLLAAYGETPSCYTKPSLPRLAALFEPTACVVELTGDVSVTELLPHLAPHDARLLLACDDSSPASGLYLDGSGASWYRRPADDVASFRPPLRVSD